MYTVFYVSKNSKCKAEIQTGANRQTRPCYKLPARDMLVTKSQRDGKKMSGQRHIRRSKRTSSGWLLCYEVTDTEKVFTEIKRDTL